MIDHEIRHERGGLVVSLHLSILQASEAVGADYEAFRVSMLKRFQAVGEETIARVVQLGVGSQAEGEREVGHVLWFDDAKGYGFIEAQDGTHVFVHFKEIQADGYKTLVSGNRVSFTRMQGPRGYHAQAVTKMVAI